MHREKAFGTDRYALPLTLNGAMKEDIDAVTAGCFTLLPETDEKGRAIIYADTSKGLLFHEDQVSISCTRFLSDTQYFDFSIFLSCVLFHYRHSTSESGGISCMLQWKTQAYQRLDLLS